MSKHSVRESDDLPMGRIVYDELGNPVWEPYTAVRSEQTLNRILQTDRLSLADGGQKQNSRTKDGYDPYGSGLVERDGERPRKKDLRALSEWVKMKKRLESGG